MLAPRVLVVIPTFDESENIVEVIRSIRSTVPAASLLVVDDSSPDGTADLVTELAGELGRVHVLSRPRKQGLGGAYRAGFEWARDRGYDTIVQMDADLSHAPADLPALLAAAASGSHLVIGSRYVEGGDIVGWPRSRRALSKWGNRYASGLLRLPVADSTSGYRVWRGAMLDALTAQSVRADGYGFQIEMAFRAHRSGGTIAEVPVRFVDRQRGSSKLDRSIIVEAAVLVLRLALRPVAIDRGVQALTTV